MFAMFAREQSEHRLLARISFVYIVTNFSLDRSLVLNSCNRQYTLFLSYSQTWGVGSSSLLYHLCLYLVLL